MVSSERWDVIDRVGHWHGQALAIPEVRVDQRLTEAAGPATEQAATGGEPPPSGQATTSDEPSGAPRRPRTDQERAIAVIWAQLLDVDVDTIDTDFFDLGGQSLVVLRLAADLEAEFGLPVQMADLFTHTTVAAQAELVEQLYERLLAEVLATPASVNAARAA